VTASRSTGPRTRLPMEKATDLSRRCTATLHFPTAPYHNLRCKLRPHNPGDLHVAETTVPTEYVPPTQASWRKPAMATVRITWLDESTKPTN